MARLLDGTRVYGRLNVDSNLTITGANSTTIVTIGDSTSNLKLSNTSVTFSDGTVQTTAAYNTPVGLYYAISAGMIMT